MYLARIRRHQGRWDEERALFEKAKEFFEQQNDLYGLANVYIEMKFGLGYRGLWKELFTIQKHLEELYNQLPKSVFLKSRILAVWGWSWALAGDLSKSEQDARESIDLIHSLDNITALPTPLRDLGWALGHQGRYLEADQNFAESIEIVQRLGKDYSFHLTAGLTFWSVVLTRQGKIKEAEAYLLRCLDLKEQLGDTPARLWPFVCLGNLYEVQKEFDKALDYHNRCLTWKWFKPYYFYSQSLTGLVRVQHAQADYTSIPPLLTEAEQLARQYEYNDHLASLRLTQGHITWDGNLPEWGNGFEAALRYYQQALIHALRFNRFLLDEVLWGGGVCTPLRPIIPHCQERGDQGRQMLTALHDWWQSGVNDIGMPRPDTISPIPEGIPLLEAERLARQREPGDNSPQSTVLNQLGSALN